MPTYTVMRHYHCTRTREGWESGDIHPAGTIRIHGYVTARNLLKTIRDECGFPLTGPMESVQRAISSTPYMGGHIDIVARGGKPLLYLERHVNDCQCDVCSNGI